MALGTAVAETLENDYLSQYGSSIEEQLSRIVNEVISRQEANPIVSIGHALLKSQGVGEVQHQPVDSHYKPPTAKSGRIKMHPPRRRRKRARRHHDDPRWDAAGFERWLDDTGVRWVPVAVLREVSTRYRRGEWVAPLRVELETRSVVGAPPLR